MNILLRTLTVFLRFIIPTGTCNTQVSQKVAYPLKTFDHLTSNPLLNLCPQAASNGTHGQSFVCDDLAIDLATVTWLAR